MVLLFCCYCPPRLLHLNRSTYRADNAGTGWTVYGLFCYTCRLLRTFLFCWVLLPHACLTGAVLLPAGAAAVRRRATALLANDHRRARTLPACHSLDNARAVTVCHHCHFGSRLNVCRSACSTILHVR